MLTCLIVVMKISFVTRHSRRKNTAGIQQKIRWDNKKGQAWTSLSVLYQHTFTGTNKVFDTLMFSVCGTSWSRYHFKVPVTQYHYPVNQTIQIINQWNIYIIFICWPLSISMILQKKPNIAYGRTLHSILVINTILQFPIKPIFSSLFIKNEKEYYHFEIWIEVS